MAGIQIDGVNNKIDFDDDLDTSISANTDDTLVIEAGGNTMATITATTFTINDGTTITTADNTDTLSLISTDADALVGPNLNFYRNSSSPADGDLMGQIKFTGESAGSGIHTYGSIVMENNGVTDGQEQGKIKFNISMPDGALANVFNIDRTEICINEDSEDLDFRVESNGNTHMLFVDGGNNRVGVGTAPDLGVGLHIRTADSGASNVANADDLIIEGSGVAGISIFTGTSSAGQINFGDSGANERGKLLYDHATDTMLLHAGSEAAFRIKDLKLSSYNEAAPDVEQGGLTLQQGGDDGNILTFKSSDIAHGMTDNGETDTYFFMKKGNPTEGGVYMQGFSESGSPGIRMTGATTSASQTEATNAEGSINLEGSLKSGNSIDAHGADDNILIVRNHGSTRFIVKGDGELFSDQSATVGTYDTYEDAQLVRSLELSRGSAMTGLINSQFDKYIKYNHETLADANLVGREDDGTPNHFVNITGMQRLHNGRFFPTH